jgi:Zn-dependent protease with chaperone function
MTQTMPHSYRSPESELQGSIPLPEVDLPPRPGLRRRAGLVALVLTGYVYVLGMLLVLALGMLGLGFIWIIFVLVPLLGAVLPALRLKLTPPDGLKLTRANAPDLLELIERHRKRLKAPRLSGVVLVDEPTAFAYEVPRLGVLGWNRIYLGIGAPYLVALSPEELEGVVVHELAHVARRHVASAAGLRSSLGRWQQLDARLEEHRHWSSRFFRPFLRRYIPRLERSTLAFSRWHEYEADRLAAEAVGEAAATGLVRISLLDRHLGEVLWDDVFRLADDVATPPAPYSRMRSAARVPFASPRARLADLVRRVESDWTHPTLAQRLRGMGDDRIELTRLKPPTASAGDVYTGGHLFDLLASLDEAWQGRVESGWRERHDEAQELRQQLDSLGSDERLERAFLTARLHGAAAAEPLFAAILREEPDHAPASYWVGRAQLERGDDRGLGALERAVALDVHATPDATETAVSFLVDAERLEEADEWRDRNGQYLFRIALADHERSQISETDEVEPHGLADETVQQVTATLRGLKTIKRAYLVRKRLAEFEDEAPLWIVGIRVRDRAFRLYRAKDTTGIVDRCLAELEPILGAHFWVVVLEGAYAPLEPRMNAIRGARVVGRKARTVALRRSAGLRTVALAAFVCLALLFAAIRLVEGPAPSSSSAPVEDVESAGSMPTGISDWGKKAQEGCLAIRGGETAPSNRRAQAAWERAFIAALAEAGSTTGSNVAIRLAQTRLAALEEALALEEAGDAAGRDAALRRHDRNLAANRALTALGAPACAAPSRVAPVR